MQNQSLQTLLQEATSTTIEFTSDPCLTDRIMDQVISLHEPKYQFYQTLWDAFKPVAAMCILITLGFLSFNMMLSRKYEVTLTPIEIVFGLEPMTLSTTYLSDLDEFPATIP